MKPALRLEVICLCHCNAFPKLVFKRFAMESKLPRTSTNVQSAKSRICGESSRWTSLLQYKYRPRPSHSRLRPINSKRRVLQAALKSDMDSMIPDLVRRVSCRPCGTCLHLLYAKNEEQKSTLATMGTKLQEVMTAPVSKPPPESVTPSQSRVKDLPWKQRVQGKLHTKEISWKSWATSLLIA